MNYGRESHSAQAFQLLPPRPAVKSPLPYRVHTQSSQLVLLPLAVLPARLRPRVTDTAILAAPLPPDRDASGSVVSAASTAASNDRSEDAQVARSGEAAEIRQQPAHPGGDRRNEGRDLRRQYRRDEAMAGSGRPQWEAPADHGLRLWRAGSAVTYPGPTFVAERGHPIQVIWQNHLSLTGHLLPVDS